MDDITNAKDSQVYIRRPRPTDQSYIASTWVNSLIQVRGQTKSESNAIVDRMLDDPSVRLMLAVEPTAINTILGWLCYTPLSKAFAVHYVYVRDKMRRRGIATAMMARANNEDRKLVWTMRGPEANWLIEKHKRAVYLSVSEFLGP